MARPRSRRELELVSSEVTRGRYFFLDLVAKTTGPVRVALGGHERCGARYRVQRDSYPFATLELVIEGTGTIAYGGAEPQMIRAGSLFAHGPGVSIRMETGPGQTLVKTFVCLTGRGARALIEAHAPVFSRAVTLGHPAEIRDVFELLLREGARQTSFTRNICDQLAQVLLLKIGEACRHRGNTARSPAREKFLRCRNLIDEQGARFSSLAEVASALHAEPSGLSRLFRRYQGVSPYQYLLRHKMNLAAQDLISSGGFVKEVAARAGYSDAYHFSRVFKAVHGIAPAHFPRLNEA